VRKLANIARRVFGNSVQASYFERFHWSILNFWTQQTTEHAVPCSVAVMLHGLGKCPDRVLLGFEYLESFTANNFEVFCECDEVY
jgi:hypothetical protein